MEDVGTSRSIPSDDVLLAAFAKINKRRREEVVRQRRNNELKKNIAESSSSEAERTAATVDLFSCVRTRSKRQLCSEDDIDASPRPTIFEINTTESAHNYSIRQDNVSETSSMVTDDVSVASSPTTPVQLQTDSELDSALHSHMDDHLSTLDDVLTPLGNSSNTDCDQGEQNVSFVLDIGFINSVGYW